MLLILETINPVSCHHDDMWKSAVPMDVAPLNQVRDRRAELADIKADLFEALLDDSDGPDVEVLIHRAAALLGR